jgi:predicted amidophosphoribosyltransferase
MINTIPSIMKMSLLPFDCVWKGKYIEVLQIDGESVVPVGVYNVITSNICSKCGNPYLINGNCFENYLHTHLRNVDGIFQIGFYYNRNSIGRKASNDLLNGHIWRAKSNEEFTKALAKGLLLVAQNLFPILLEADVIVPVPNHKDDPYFDFKAVGIARELSRLLISNGMNIFMLECLKKVKNIKLRPLDQVDREQAVEGMFKFDTSKSVNGKKVILVDDVLTAGNAKGKCVDILKQYGAEKVWIFVAGRNT